MQFIDLERQYRVIEDDVKRRMNNVLETQHYIMGPEVLEMEKKLADFVGRKYCLSCASGTDALVIPLMAYGLTKKDAVFVPSFTFFASAESVNLAGGTPIFVDIDEYYNMNPDSLEKAINKTLEEGKLIPRGIIPVDLFGQSADYDAILPIAEKYGLFVLEDAAQGFGGNIRGKRNGSFGDVSATSFFPAKPLGCYGDGGAIFTDDEKLYKLMTSIRVHGQGNDKYDNVRMGLNGRMDTLQAAVILSKLEVFEKELIERNRVADSYRRHLEGVFELPKVQEGFYSSWAQFTMRAKDSEQRDEIIAKMKKKNIPIMVYYPIPLHEQTAYSSENHDKESLRFGSEVAKRVFSVPMHPYLEENEIVAICDALKDIVGA